MKYGVVYIVINEGEVAYASVDREETEEFANDRNYMAREEVLAEWENDDPSEENLAEADFQVGYNGDYYKVECIDISNCSEDDIIELEDGTEIEVSDILAKLE